MPTLNQNKSLQYLTTQKMLAANCHGAALVLTKQKQQPYLMLQETWKAEEEFL